MALLSDSVNPEEVIFSSGSETLAVAWEPGSAGPLEQAARPATRMRIGNKLFIGTHLAHEPTCSPLVKL
jgi:hypothetical protein